MAKNVLKCLLHKMPPDIRPSEMGLAHLSDSSFEMLLPLELQILYNR